MVERLLRDQQPPAVDGNLVSELSPPMVKHTVGGRAREHARKIATGYVRDPIPDTSPMSCSEPSTKSLFFWAVKPAGASHFRCGIVGRE